MAAQITALPTPPTRQDPTNFNDRADAFLAALPGFQSEANALSTEVNTRADNVQASDLAVLAATNITKWVSGTTYAQGVVVWSPINGLGYRRITASGSGTTDPSSDSTNYRQVNGTGNVSTDVNGNLGLGVTPSAWVGGNGVVEFVHGGSISSVGSSTVWFGNNHYYNGTNYIYKTTNAAALYGVGQGTHTWYTAPSGTAGNTISFTQAMTLDASGVLQVPNGVSASLKPALNGGVIWPNDPLGGSGDTASITLESAGGENMSMAFRLTNDPDDKFQFYSSGTGTFNNNMLLNGNVVLNAANYNDYAPTKTGGGASGTWGINVTGNAATATNATTAVNANYATSAGSATTAVNANYATSATMLSTASGAAPSYSARAWVNFNGTGTVAIRNSGNVSSITDHGVGDYTVNFTTAMPDADYVIASCAERASGEYVPSVSMQVPAARSASAIRLIVGYENLSNDRSYINVVIFR